MERFRVFDESHTGSDCTEFSVIDTQVGTRDYMWESPDAYVGKWKKCICETMDKADAEYIAKVLNEYYERLKLT